VLIAGKPTLTTEPSMNARLDAKMVVARTRVECLGEEWRVSAFAMPASQIVWIAELTWPPFSAGGWAGEWGPISA